MSGGHFDYMQYGLSTLADDAQELLDTHDIPDDFGYAYNLDKTVIPYLKEVIYNLRLTAVYLQRIDWYVSGDDSLESFHKRMREDLDEFNRLHLPI